MAYGVKYLMGCVAPQADPPVEVHVVIEEQDYTGAVTSLKSKFNTYRITRDFTDIETNVLGMKVELQIVNDFEDFFSLMDLMNSVERQFRIRVYAYEYKILVAHLFEGYINTELTEQKYLRWQTLKLTASSYLGKLKHYSTSELNVVQGVTYIDLITSMLRQLGSEHDILINCSLMPTEDYGVQLTEPGNPGYTLFSKCGCITELFWENNIERKDSYYVLDEIMKSFNCYIYWWDNNWYIEHYDNIWSSTGSKDFVKYDINTQYAPADLGIYVREGRAINEIHADLLFTEMSQTLGVIPGMRQVVIKIDDKQYSNLVSSLQYPMVVTSDWTPDLELRNWARYEAIAGYIDWDKVAEPFQDIENAIQKTNTDPDAYFANSRNTHHGLYCDFRVTVKEGETILNLKWKYNLDGTWVQNGTDAVKFRQIWYLRLVGTDTYVYYNDVVGWYLRTGTSTDGSVFDTMYHNFTQPDFDEETQTYQVSISFPINELNEVENSYYPVLLPFSGDYTFQLTIGLVERQTNQDWRSLESAYFGDINLGVSGNVLDDNYIEGTLNTDFLNKKEISITLADQTDLTYVNGILRGDELLERTSTWRSKFSGDSDVSLVDRLLINKFRFYNVVRQKIKGNIHTVGLLWKPFMLFQDSKQSDLKFIMVGLQHRFDINQYDVSLLEYDNTTVVNLIEE